MLSRIGFIALLAVSLAWAAEEVTVEAGVYRLHGCVWTPDGAGPFPVMIYNHGSEKNPFPCGPPDLARFYRKNGWAFFAFERHGHGTSAGAYIVDLQKQAANRQAINHLHELYNLDVEAAVGWVKRQKWADSGRIAMSGVSYGGIQTLLTAEKGLGIRAFLPFAPAAQSWNPVLAERLIEAIRKARGPIFLIQAANDYSLEPSRVLGAELEKKGGLNRAKVYPAFGTTKLQGHAWFATRAAGIEIWSAEVVEFLKGTGL